MPPAAQLQTEQNADRQFDAAQVQRVDLAAQVDRLTADMHAVKGNLAANTAITLETATAMDAIKVLLGKIDVDKIAQLVGVVDDMKGGVKVLGWLERPFKWIATLLGLFTAGYAAWHSWNK